MFKKLVCIEPPRLLPETMEALKQYAEEIILYPDIPKNNFEIIQRIGNADGVLLSYTSRIDREVLAQCTNIKYIGMCCSLYSPESANVDILAAGEKGIVVKGVRDYGDAGVGEYVICELVRLLHGRDGRRWRDEPLELTGLETGVVGLGASGQVVADALRFFGANVSYYSRSRKLDLENEKGYRYLPLDSLLSQVDILCTCLTKNTVVLGEEEFKRFGNGKILINTSIAPSHEIPALKKWLAKGDNYILSDTSAGIGEGEDLLSMPNVQFTDRSAGLTFQAKRRLGEKVLENMIAYFKGK